MIKKVDIYLSDKELDFLQWLSKYDNDFDKKNRTADTKWTVNKELNCLVSIKLSEMIDFYESEGLYKEGEA